MSFHSIFKQRISATKDKSDEEEIESNVSESPINQSPNAVDGIATSLEEQLDRGSVVISPRVPLPQSLTRKVAVQR